MHVSQQHLIQGGHHYVKCANIIESAVCVASIALLLLVQLGHDCCILSKL